MGWNQIRWTEASQIASLLGISGDAAPAAGVAPQEHFAALRASGDRVGAVAFLAAALPRLEALAWAGHVVEAAAAERQLPVADRQALDHALRWLGEPTEASRRAAREAAEAADERSPERLLAMGVFFSGGSISDPDLPPVPPSPDVAGRFAGTAIIVAATRHPPDSAAAFDRALDLGDRLATEGLTVLEAA